MPNTENFRAFAAPSLRFLTRAEVEHLTSMGRSRIYQLMSDADPSRRFPAPAKIGRSCRWVETEVKGWMARQVERSRADAA